MKTFACAFALLFLLTISAFAQKSTPTPPPVDEDDGDVVKISTSLIQIDVSVTDKDGKQITDLKPEDFEILENGEVQTITNFSYVAVSTDVKKEKEKEKEAGNKSNAKNQIAVPPVPNKLRPEQVRRTIVLLVDDLGLSFGSMFSTKQAVKKFIDEQMQPNDLVAIMRTGAGLGSLQQFTSDKRILYAALSKIKWTLGRATIGTYDPLRPSTKDLLTGTVNSDGQSQSVPGTEEDKKAEKSFSEFRAEHYTVGTLGAINYIIRGMSELPGRKAVMLFSDGFVITEEMLPIVKRLTEAANRAGVVINAVDSRGLTNPLVVGTDEDTRGLLDTLETVQSDRRQELLQSQGGLIYLAAETGGRAFKNTNGLSDAVYKALNDQNGYYLLGYQPDASTFDADKSKYNKLVIRVKRPGLTVRYRSGFFSVADEKNQTAKTPQRKLVDALTSPFGATGINMRLTSIYANDAKIGNFVRALVHIDTKDIKFTDEPNGDKKTSLDVFAYTFGEKGNIVGNLTRNYTLTIKKEEFPRVLERGLIYSMIVPVQKPGAYQLRLAVRDIQGEKIGAANQFIEVPNLEKDGLTLSGIVLQNYTPDQWKTRLEANIQKVSSGKAQNLDAQTITATRAFKRGTYLLFNYAIYNARINRANAQLQAQARLFKDGQLVFEGKMMPVKTAGQADLKRIEGEGAITLGSNLPAGDYVLQIVVVDSLAKEKGKIETQWVDFEIVE